MHDMPLSNQSSGLTPTQPGKIYDLAIIGGGINGVGIAADAAGRGLSVLLCEQDDLAQHTSSASSKLIHGGLRYLEHGEFRLVRESLAEREVLLAKAPHIVRPLRFVLPHRSRLRPAWLVRAGLFLYDHLAMSRHSILPASRGIRLPREGPLKPEIRRAFTYFDCQVDDTRLVVLNAVAARERGADLQPRTRCLDARRQEGLWRLELQRRGNGTRQTVLARALINATGPWVTRFSEDALHLRPAHNIRLVQGSHLITPRLYEGDEAYVLQNEDRRIVFVMPYLQDFSLIGTTEQEFAGDPADVTIDEKEIDYLLRVINTYFARPLQRSDIRHSFSGVRPLLDDESPDPSALSRDYSLVLDTAPGRAALLTVFGGKLTTYRKLAETALERLAPCLPPMGPRWTADVPLPGGEDMNDPRSLAETLQKEFAWLPPALARRWASTYGSRTRKLLAGASGIGDLGEHLGGQLYAREIDYLYAHEWAEQAEDILWRRTKLGLTLGSAEQKRLVAYLEAHRNALPDTAMPSTAEPSPTSGAAPADKAARPPATAP